jgi:hypothetical protein
VPKRTQEMKKKSGAQEIRFFGKNRISQTAQGVIALRFLGKIGFLKPPKVAKKSLGKIGFLKPCPRCPKNQIFGKNRISQTMPKVAKKSDFWEKSDFSNRAQGAIDLRFFGKNQISQTVPKAPKKSLGKLGFLKPCPRCHRSPIFWT